MSWFDRRRWRGKQWIDVYGRQWFEDARGLWWRNQMTLTDLLTFEPSRRRPPRECEPYTQALIPMRPRRFVDLCPQLEGLP